MIAETERKAEQAAVGWAATAAEVWGVVSGSRDALLTVAAVRGRLGLRGSGRASVDGVADALAELESEGKVETWECDPPVVVLSALSAEALGLALNDGGTRWEPATKKNRPHRLKRRAKVRNEAETGVSQSKRPDPASVALVSDAPAGDGYGPARVLLGEGLIWDGPGWAKGRPCPGCAGDRELAALLEGAGAARGWLAELGARTCLLCSARVGERQDPRRREHVSRSTARAIYKMGGGR